LTTNIQKNIGEIEIQHTKQFLEVQTSHKIEELVEIKTKLSTMISNIKNPSGECNTKNILKYLDKLLSLFKPAINTKKQKTTLLKKLVIRYKNGPRQRQRRLLHNCYQNLPRPKKKATLRP